MNKTEAMVERDRLRRLLETYETSRVAHAEVDQQRNNMRDVIPDRAENVRARIARLDDLLATSGPAEARRHPPS